MSDGNGVVSNKYGVVFTNCNASDVKISTHNNDVKRDKLDKKSLLVLIFGILLLVVGVILITVAATGKNNTKKPSKMNMCDYSEEAKRIKFSEFLLKVRENYYKVFPEQIAWHPDSTANKIRQKFQVHDPRPEHLKEITEHAQKLLHEANQMNPDLSKLKPREHKAFLQTVHFLENTFGYFDLNYTTGLWMLGPSSFCSNPMCAIGFGVHNAIGTMKPYDKPTVEKVARHFKGLNQSIYDYIDVLRMGVKKGMVRTQSECRAGIDVMAVTFANISRVGAKGINREWYTKKFYNPMFYQNVSKDLNAEYQKNYGKNVSQYLQDLLLESVGASLSNLLNFLKNEHYLHCRPDNIGAGGLSALPINVIYYNGSIMEKSTDPFLPLCTGGPTKCRLNGSEAYASILGYYTTKKIHPLEVHQLGWDNLCKLYPQVIAIAKSVTNLLNESTGVEEFQKILMNHSISYFNDKPLPENETKGDAFTKCSTEETAKIYCPNRWAAMMKWFKFAQMAMSIHDPNTVDFFYFTGDRHSTPNCPVKLKPDFIPSSGAQSYDNSDVNCSRPCHYNIPFFLENLGPKFSEYSVNAHEARPGHHTQVQGLAEHFRDKCGGPEGWIDSSTYFTAFTEGWALYAENPLIAQETTIYKNNPMQKFGMLKWQIWRALRLIVDTGLHYKGMTRGEALKLFAKYAWDNTDLSRKEVTRYQSNFGQATAYMIGQLDIWSLRNSTEKKLKEKFSLKEFHFQTLSQGSSPLAYLKSHIGKYIQCKLDASGQYCDTILNPTKTSKNVSPCVRNSNFIWPIRRHYI